MTDIKIQIEDYLERLRNSHIYEIPTYEIPTYERYDFTPIQHVPDIGIETIQGHIPELTEGIRPEYLTGYTPPPHKIGEPGITIPTEIIPDEPEDPAPIAQPIEPEIVYPVDEVVKDNTEPITEEPKNYDWLYIIVGIILFYIIVIRGGKL